ncbi:hypothetical protein Cs7R123_56850 [Catellatospora sp. TT07R-123]|uniref:hypothetical protein n=1 Tax=Catellatospora sp. TT07R-123 TaxID=2733863 RepID=UPI001B2EBE8B|nr:hypothetical protein [Catellatospora sp. TT07R-123]GHJ48343.1 hypothetical protein Cs7R123_56850 [Catellatospora sp. TT07R-123]
MSDLYIRVIPTDPQWQPTAEAADRATEYVAGLFSGPGDDVESVKPVFYEHIMLIDGGEYMEDLFCPRCDAAIGLDWFWKLGGEDSSRWLTGLTIGDLDVTVPCCGSPLMLPELRFEAPIGFARFEVRAMNWTRHAWDLSDEELATAGAILGHAVTQVHTHY